MGCYRSPFPGNESDLKSRYMAQQVGNIHRTGSANHIFVDNGHAGGCIREGLLQPGNGKDNREIVEIVLLRYLTLRRRTHRYSNAQNGAGQPLLRSG